MKERSEGMIEGGTLLQYMTRPFLAWLDYVSRAHEIEIRPSSVASIISEVIAWISYKF